MKKEAIQIAAMAFRFQEKYNPGMNHTLYLIFNANNFKICH